jgi:carbon-monoxide dehydrogenase medium subunit
LHFCFSGTLFLGRLELVNAFKYAAPKTLAEASSLLAAHGERARILAGGTDLIVQIREGRRDVDLVVDIKETPEVNTLAFDPERGLTLGASVPCYRIHEDEHLRKAYPGLHDGASLVGGVQIQSRATVGGNLCNSSPAADTIPALIALRGMCRIYGPGGWREVPVENFCTGPGKNVLGRGEVLASIHFPVPWRPGSSSYLRFIPRNEMDIAVVGVGVALHLDAKRERCVEARISLAAVAPTPLLVAEAGAALAGQALTEEVLRTAAARARDAARPIDDMRGDAEYRKHLVGVLTYRCLQLALTRARGN